MSETTLSPRTEQTPAIETITRSRNVAELSADHQRFLKTGELESAVLGKIGTIPNPDDFGSFTGGEYSGESPLGNLERVKIQNGQLDFSGSSITDDTLAEAQRRLGPLLQMVDADYRERAGLGPEAVTTPYITYHAGQFDERAARSANQPHIDGDGLSPNIMYFAANGAGTKIYPGKFQYDNPGDYLGVILFLQRKIKEEDIQPVQLESGDVVAVGWDTVHAGPGAESIGQERSFIRVWYQG